MIVISETHNSLIEEKFKKFMEEHSNYDVCLLLGDHNFNDIIVILKYINKENKLIFKTLKEIQPYYWLDKK